MDIHETFWRIHENPVYLIYVALRAVCRAFIGKQRRNEYFKLRISDLVRFAYVKRTQDNFLFYVRKRGDACIAGMGLSKFSHEPEVRKIFQPNAKEVVVDIGAHVGTYAIRLAKKARCVIAVEPHPSTFQVLKHNIELNKLENILAVNVGIGREDCILHLKRFPDYGLTQLSATQTGDPVKVRSLDSLMEELKNKRLVEKVDWIKIDAEGMELDILYGAKETLAKHNPKLIIEIHRDEQEISKFLNENSFSIKRLDINHIFAWKIERIEGQY